MLLLLLLLFCVAIVHHYCASPYFNSVVVNSQLSLSSLFLLHSGIPILRVWNATFTAPPQCHIGHGVDCVHFYIPSAIADYFAMTLLEFMASHVTSP